MTEASMPPGRVCFVVSELLGLVRNGGIATATSHAALVLSNQGYVVDLLYCGSTPEMEEHWAKRYADAGVGVKWLDRSTFVHPHWLADSYRAYHQLKAQPYDTIVFQDWQGLGFASVVAKRARLAFERTRLIHIVHGPNDWLREANRMLEMDARQLGVALVERRSAELSDVIVGPSHHLIDWMVHRGWDLPHARHVIPYFTEGHTRDIAYRVIDEDRSLTPLTELVFFGRLEERKGVRVLIGALNLLGADVVSGLKVTFLGRPATITPDDVTREIADDVRASLDDLAFIGGYDQSAARDYLKGPGRLALIPSYLDNSPNVVYECLEDRISFLASRAGGTGELVAEEDRAFSLFDPDPTSLADALRPLIASRQKPPPPRPAFDGEVSLDAWRPLLEPLDAPASPRRKRKADELPPVSVVIAHHNQPTLVWDAVRSIDEQDYPSEIEILVIDDGSDDEARANLDKVAGHPWTHPVEIHYQENRYLGAARNHGLRRSRFEFVAFVDDDDTVDPTYLRYMGLAQRGFDADAVTVAVHSITTTDDGQIDEGAHESIWAFIGDAAPLSTAANLMGGAAALFRRSVLERVGGYHEQRGVGHEDWEVLVRISLSGGKVVCIPEAPYHYRVRPGSMLRTTSVWSNMQPVFEAYREHLPTPLRSWPELTRGQQDVIDQLSADLGRAILRIQELEREIDARDRYLTLMRRSLEQ